MFCLSLEHCRRTFKHLTIRADLRVPETKQNRVSTLQEVSSVFNQMCSNLPGQMSFSQTQLFTDVVFGIYAWRMGSLRRHPPPLSPRVVSKGGRVNKEHLRHEATFKKKKVLLTRLETFPVFLNMALAEHTARSNGANSLQQC